MEIKRDISVPDRSFLLLGPRGCGKSTLLKAWRDYELGIDLLHSDKFLRLSARPSELREMTRNLSPGSWVFIDEIQRIPELMNEIQAIYSSQKLNFALTGSSARKLKRGGANLLAGRLLSLKLFTLTCTELSEQVDLDTLIQWGCLPQTINEPKFRNDFLSTYVETYLREELMEEGIIRKLEPYVRFLQIVGIYAGQILNVENIARESHVSRTTVDNYIQILEDTLIAYRLPPVQKKWNKKEVKHPKFYLFDNGVARSCAGLLNESLDPSWLGYAFESLIVNEVRAYNHYLKAHRELFYYRYNGGYEIDLLIEVQKKTLRTPQKFCAVEIKSSSKWDKRWNEPMQDLAEKSKGQVSRLVGVYRGKETISFPNVEVLPVKVFLRKLSLGEFFGLPNQERLT